MADQLGLYSAKLPRIKERRYPGVSASLDPYKQTSNDGLTPSSWLPGERDRYRPICPPGYVDACPVEASPRELKWRHNSWWSTREKVMRSMQRANLPPTRVARFANCGGGAWVYQCPKTGDCEVNANNCGDRLCVPCQRARSGVIAAQLAGQLKGRECRHVVLTLKHAAIPLADQITRIYQCFSNLRRHNLWKRKAVGGAAFCEIKLGRDGRWHVHLHILVEGTYLPHHALSGAWLVATGDSDVVWVGAVPEGSKIAGYVAKYVTKAIDQTVIDAGEKLDEAIIALRGRRACFTFGTWRGVCLRPERAPREGWKALGRLDAIMQQASGGSLWAAGVLKNLHFRGKSDETHESGVQSCGPPNRDGS